MKSTCIIGWLLVVILLLFSSAQPLHALRSEKKTLPAVIPTPQYAPQQVIIKFRQNVTVTDRHLFKQQTRLTVNNRQDAIQSFHSYFKTTPKGNEVLGWQKVSLPAGASVSKALEDYAANALVESIEPNYIRAISALSTTYTAYSRPDDPYYQDGETLWWFNRTKADAAYSKSYDFGTGDIIVAVVDTGVDLDHAELSGMLVSGYNAVTPTGQPDDDEGHGTHVAGLVSAIGNNAAGICGTGFASQVKVMPVKVLDYNGEGTTADIINGIYWAVNNGAHVLNMSFGGYSLSASEQEACNYAYNQGCVLVAASGNDNIDMNYYPCYPAAFDNVISVGATDAEDYVTYYSNWGEDLIDVCAPGGMTSGMYADGGITSTYPDNDYEAMAGTSMASPQVAGFAAMLLALDPTLSPDNVLDKLKASCENYQNEWDGYIGSGRVNAQVLFADYEAATPSVTPTPTPTPTISLTPTISATTTITPTVSVTSTHTATCTPFAMADREAVFYPQPARNNIKLALHVSGQAQVTVNFYNVTGERVMTYEALPYANGGTAIMKINCQQLVPGMYFSVTRVTDDTGTWQVKKRLAVIH